MKILLIALLFLSNVVCADSVFYGGYTYHFQDIKYKDGSVVPKDQVNNTNDLIGVEYKGYGLSSFTNSYNDQSYMLGKQFYNVSMGDVELDLHAAVYTGYNVCVIAKIKDKVCAAIVPEIKYTKYRLQPSIIVLGKGVSLMFRYEFKDR